ncbi:MAG: 3-isopropylmalate dehydratase small subunit [Sporomusaceae bacterium]|jgi:3-isopropylmalate/(R)-2-methylmalate dehydratase small subunit|nr:3-isopropylmalate dehydratase small subunit [Sporomusaceae bacterium]
MILTGKAWRYGDNVDTDVIIPARYLNMYKGEELAAHALEDLDPTFAAAVQKGDIIVAGKNFGCGSSREHAPLTIKASGVSCVVAESFARIFYRNAINIGLLLIETGAPIEKIAAGDTVSVDLEQGIVTNSANGTKITAPALPAFIQKISAAGGLAPYTKKRLAAKEN